MARIPYCPGHADGGRAAAGVVETVDYPLVMGFLRSVQGRTVIESGYKLWPIWAGILKVGHRLRD